MRTYDKYSEVSENGYELNVGDLVVVKDVHSWYTGYEGRIYDKNMYYDVHGEKVYTVSVEVQSRTGNAKIAFLLWPVQCELIACGMKHKR